MQEGLRVNGFDSGIINYKKNIDSDSLFDFVRFS